VEVVEIGGIIDSPLERAITTTIRDAEREGAEAVVIQIDSAGGIGDGRPTRLSAAIRDSRVPVATWIGPPGARAGGAAAVLALSGHEVAMAPGSALGPARSLDLRDRAPRRAPASDVLSSTGRAGADVLATRPSALSADEAQQSGLVDVVALQLPDLLRRLDARVVTVDGAERTMRTDPGSLSVRFRKHDIAGRVLHAVTKPSVAYLLLLGGLVGVVFELFHPSTGPAGLSGLFSLALAGYGLWVMSASRLGAGLLVGGVALLCVDLRLVSLGVFTVAGLAGLVAGSLLLFPAPKLHASPWMLAFGVLGMAAFMMGAMTRVLSDIRAVARGDQQIVDIHELVGEPGVSTPGVRGGGLGEEHGVLRPQSDEEKR
jgi:membrane-bound serine protease (ClpP class)